MKSEGYTYGICLASDYLRAESWQRFWQKLVDYVGSIGSWKIEGVIRDGKLELYLWSSLELPASIGVDGFLLKPVIARARPNEASKIARNLYFLERGDNFIDMVEKLKQRGMTSVTLRVKFYVCGKTYFALTALTFCYKNRLMCTKLLFRTPAELLAIDFARYPNYTYQHFPKCLDAGKALRLLSANAQGAILLAEAFPYRVDKNLLSLANYDFYKHSLVLGGSGSGKSKFITLLIAQILKEHAGQYKIVVIDPHDALREDFANHDQCMVMDFTEATHSVDLFASYGEDTNASIELSLATFAALMAESYNSYVDRVLRYGIFILLKAKKFSLIALRRMLTEVEYRHSLIDACREVLPESVARFFLTEYNSLQTQHYDAAIAPIIAFVDEMQMVPVFNQESINSTLLGCVQRSNLNIFSLNRTKLGTKVVKMIAGLLLQQLFVMAQKQLISQPLIIMIDEVAVVENPILARILSELRKYQTSVILIGQYFEQFSADLRAAVYANVANYYIFRVSRDDALELTQHLKLKTLHHDSIAARAEILSSLKLRECVVQLSHEDTAYPAFKARTLDYVSEKSSQGEQNKYLHRLLALPAATKVQYVVTDSQVIFGWNDAEDVKTVMRSVTTRRKRWGEPVAAYPRDDRFWGF